MFPRTGVTAPDRSVGSRLPPTMSARELRLLSVVAPMLDEEGLAAEFCSRVASSLEGLPYELVIVDDGSSDATPAILDELAGADPRIPELLQTWREGADVVVARRRFRSGETRFKLATARWFYGIMGRLAQVDLEA